MGLLAQPFEGPGLRNVSHEVTKPRRRRGVLAPQALPFACFLTTVRDIPAFWGLGITVSRNYGITGLRACRGKCRDLIPPDAVANEIPEWAAGRRPAKRYRPAPGFKELKEFKENGDGGLWRR